MYLFKATTEEEYIDERRQIVWEMVSAQLVASHARLMGQLGLPLASSDAVADEAESVLRPVRPSGPALARVHYRPTGPLRGSRGY